jgi:hypothetical protein
VANGTLIPHQKQERAMNASVIDEHRLQLALVSGLLVEEIIGPAPALMR